MPKGTRPPILVMLAGLPGTGKSTLAKALEARLGWPILDKDVLNIVLLEARLEQAKAGPLAYELVLALAHTLVVGQHQSIILDTAGRQPLILERARMITHEAACQLKVIRLHAPQTVRQTRLGQRMAGPSQWVNDNTTSQEEAAWYAHLPADTFLLETEQPIEDLLPRVLAFVEL